MVGAAVAALTMQGAPYTWTGAVSSNWFEDGNWSAAGFPGASDTVSLPSGTPRAVWLTNATAVLVSLDLAAGQVLTVNGTGSVIQAGTITIAGTITHPTNDVLTTNAVGEWVPLHRVWLAGSNVTVAAGGTINVSYLGYPRTAGPGAPPVASGGAGHAGEGGFGGGGDLGRAYDDPASPEQPGSGGGANAYSSGGGGAIRIDASGPLTIEGSLLADGRNALSTHGAGGSGGSIWLTCHTLHGSTSGLVRVQGGNGNYLGGGGSGGRIAVSYNTNAQAALPEPRPPIRFHGQQGNPDYRNGDLFPAGMGTLWLPDTLLLTNVLAGQRFRYVRLVIPGFTNWALDSLTLDDGILGLPEGFVLTITNNLTLTNNAALHVFAAPVADLLAEVGARVVVGGNLNLGPGCWMMPYAHPTNGATAAFTVGGNLYVDDTGGFDADRRGYTRGFGYGSGLAAGSSGGGSYGGRSGSAFGGGASAEPYGDPASPILAGSAGTSTNIAGRGGGCIRLEVTGQARINGILTARGGGGGSTHGGAGAGGGILLACDTLVCGTNATLRADGGFGNYYGASGGGGRIALHYNPAAQAALPEPLPPIRLSAYAYHYSSQGAFRIRARMGTLWLPDTLFLANPIDRYRLWYVHLVVGSGLDAWTPDGLTISNAVFELPEGFDFHVAGDLVLAAADTRPTNLLGSNAEACIHLWATHSGALYGARLRVDGDLTLADGGWIHAYTTGSNAGVVGLRVGGDLTVAGGGGINADERGYASVVGNTNGAGAGKAAYNAGGGYGGRGGTVGGSGGLTNGSPVLPLEPGSPAGYNGYGGGYGVGGSGGGAIHALAGGALTLNGTLTARGQNGVYYRGSAGSGGSIFLTARTVSGTGTLCAAGGAQALGTDDACGGGGRIAVWYNLAPQQAEARFAGLNSAGLTNVYPLATFPAAFDVAGGAGGTTDESGTAGVYYHDCPGAVLTFH